MFRLPFGSGIASPLAAHVTSFLPRYSANHSVPQIHAAPKFVTSKMATVTIDRIEERVDGFLSLLYLAL